MGVPRFTYVDHGVGPSRPTTDELPHARYVVEEQHPFFCDGVSWSGRSPWTMLASRATRAAAVSIAVRCRTEAPTLRPRRVLDTKTGCIVHREAY